MAVEQAKSYKYLGLIIGNKLSFLEHIKVVMRKVNIRMYFVRTMKKLRVDPNIVALFFNSTIPPVLSYGCMAFYGNLPQYFKDELDKPKRSCQRLIGNNFELTDNDKEYKTKLAKFSKRYSSDTSHPLRSEYVLLPSGRRYRQVKARTERYRLSFIPASIRLLNKG